MKDKIFIGIDIGRKGGVSFYKNNEKYPFDFIYFKNKPYRDFSKNLIEIISGHDLVYCVIENVHYMPGDGGVGAFRFGQQFGWIESVFKTFNIPYILVQPAIWKKYFNCIVTVKEKKEKNLTRQQVKALTKQKVIDKIKLDMKKSSFLNELIEETSKTPTGRQSKNEDLEFYDALLIGKFCQERFEDIFYNEAGD
jgi:hypothetical protein